MTFYNALKNKITEDLQTQHLSVKVFNDVTQYLVNPKRIEEDSVVAIIKTMQSTTSKIKGLVMTSYPLYITFICNQNELQSTIEKINAYTQIVTTRVSSLTSGEYYNLSFDEVSVTSTNQEIQFKEGAFNVAILTLMGTALVSEENIEMPTFSIEDDSLGSSVVYILERIQSYTDTYSASYNQIKEIDQKIDLLSYDGASRTFQITLIKKENSSFIVWLKSYMKNYKNTKIVLNKGQESFNVVIASVSEALSQQIGVPVLVINFNECR